MDWMSAVSGVLQKYAGTSQNTEGVEDDFDQTVRSAPPDRIAEGLASAFRSDQTPPFGQMISQLFQNSGGSQKANLLNMLISGAGPGLVSQALSHHGSGLAGLLGSGQAQVTPEQADQIPAGAIEEIATEAERQNPTIVDSLSRFYAENPEIVKGLGAAALGIAMSRLASRR